MFTVEPRAPSLYEDMGHMSQGVALALLAHECEMVRPVSTAAPWRWTQGFGFSLGQNQQGLQLQKPDICSRLFPGAAPGQIFIGFHKSAWLFTDSPYLTATF